VPTVFGSFEHLVSRDLRLEQEQLGMRLWREQLTIISIYRWAERNLRDEMGTLPYGEIRNDIVALLQASRGPSARSVNPPMIANCGRSDAVSWNPNNRGSNGQNTKRSSLCNSSKIWSYVLAGHWVAQPYASAGVLSRVPGLENFADTFCKICPSS
jgi:hypothetical protein